MERKREIGRQRRKLRVIGCARVCEWVIHGRREYYTHTRPLAGLARRAFGTRIRIALTGNSENYFGNGMCDRSCAVIYSDS